MALYIHPRRTISAVQPPMVIHKVLPLDVVGAMEGECESQSGE